MPRDMKGKVIVITGASSGIGAATAIACAEAGMNVVLNARRADRLDAIAEAVRAAGGEAAAVVGDVTDEGIAARMLDVADERFGGFYAVFANAGYSFERGAIDLTSTELRRMFDVNFFAAQELLTEAGRRLRAAGRPGHLLMCSSCLSKFTLPGHGPYAASKAAQNHLCRAMRIELAADEIEVASVHPITTETEFFEVSRRLSGDPAPEGKKVPDHCPRLLVQPPQRVARAVVRCLRRPRPEVWTSFTVRVVAAAMTLAPSFADLVMRGAYKVDRAHEDKEAN